MSILLPNIRPNLRSFPGAAPRLNVTHPAYNKVRLASVATGNGGVNLVNGNAAVLGGAAAHQSAFGPALSCSTGVAANYGPCVAETLTRSTWAAIFVAATETIALAGLMSPINSRTSSLNISSAQIPTLDINGSAVVLTPALPALIAGHGYFFAASMQGAPTNGVGVVLADLTTGEVIFSTGTRALSIPTTSQLFSAPSFELNSKLNAAFYSAAALTNVQLLQWAQDPWSLWYDRSAQNVAALARKKPVSGGAVTTTFATTEARDVAAFNTVQKNSTHLTTTEARDVAAFNVTEKNSTHFATTEARDVAVFNASGAVTALFTTTEARDVASFTTVQNNSTQLAATETPDVAAFTATEKNSVQLATTEARDVAFFNAAAGVTGQLATTESPDVAQVNASDFQPAAPPVGGRIIRVHPNNLRAFPGIAPKLSQAHVAYNQGIRLAAVPLGGGSVNLVNMGKGTFGSTSRTSSSVSGPSMSSPQIGGVNGIFYQPIIPGERLVSRTYAAIFVCATEPGQKALATPSNTSAESIAAVGSSSSIVPTTPTLFNNGTAVAFTPALPTLTNGHTYFFAASMQPTAPHQIAVLADLTSGAIFTATGSNPFNVATVSLYAAPSLALTSQLNATYISAFALSMPQLLAWAADPWSLWYDRSAKNVASMAARGAPAAPNATSLTTTEAPDRAAFHATITEPVPVSPPAPPGRVVADYLAKVPPEHAGDTNFMAELALVLQPFVDIQTLISSLPSLFDLDTAIGVQLDATGLWAGITRIIPVPVPNPWFSWGVSGLGWGQGYWKGPFEGVGLSSLDDTTFRRLIRAKIAANNCNGSQPAILACLTAYFDPVDYPNTNIGVYDATDPVGGNGLTKSGMEMGVVVSGVIPNAVDLAILGQLLIPFKPAAVQIIWGVTTITGSPVFGWGVENQYISGWGVGAWGADPATVAALGPFSTDLHPIIAELLTPINPLDLGITNQAVTLMDDFGAASASDAVTASVDLGTAP